jgi:putative transcriptional regulator
MTATLDPRHHPYVTQLCAYARGIADEAIQLFIAAHLALCPACRQKLQKEEVKAGINLEDMPPETMDVTCLDNLLTRIEEHGPPACIDVTIPPRDMPASFIPEALQEYVGLYLDEFLWQSASEGSFIYQQRHAAVMLPSGLRLMRFKSGSKVKIPSGSMLLILEGSVRNLFGAYGAGDVVKGGFVSGLGAKAERETLGLIMAR